MGIGVIRKNMKKPLIVTIVLLALTTAQGAMVYVVEGNVGASYPFDAWTNAAADMHTAVGAANDGDFVVVSNGYFLLTNEIVVSNSIQIESVNGCAFTTVDAQQKSRCFVLMSTGTTLRGFTVTGGDGGFGGGIYISKDADIEACIITNNRGGPFIFTFSQEFP